MIERESSLPDIEQNERRGRNIAIHALFIRHGEKEFSAVTGDTNLTEQGKLASEIQGEALTESDAVKPYSSNTERTLETARIIAEASPTQKKMNLQVRGELAFQFSPDFFKRFRDAKKTTTEEKADEIATDWYLSFKDRRPDPDTYSPVEVAAMVARRIDIYMRMADRLNSGSKIDLVNVTHDFHIAAFLKEVMVRGDDDNPTIGFNTLNEIGGGIGYNDGFEVVITNDQTGKQTVSMNFRGQTYQIDVPKFRQLVELARSREKEESNDKK